MRFLLYLCYFILVIFMPPQPMLHWRHYTFVLSVAASMPSSVSPAPNIFLSLRENTERISINFDEICKR